MLLTLINLIAATAEI